MKINRTKTGGPLNPSAKKIASRNKLNLIHTKNPLIKSIKGLFVAIGGDYATILELLTG